MFFRIIFIYKRTLKMLLTAKNLLFIVLICSCATTSSNEISNDLNLITNLSQNYFVGIGSGVSSSEESAVKIARATALGELSANIKVHIKSRLDLYESENSNGKSFESFSQQIIEIGQATVQSPEVEIISANYNKKSKLYEIKILAKKIKSNYYKESAQSIDLNDVSELLNFLEKK
jgi:hypothetical protein